MGIRDIGKYIKKIPEFQEKAELHDEICTRTLEIVDEINTKIDEVILPTLKEIEKKCRKSK